MRRFDYVRPDTLADAVAAGSGEGARYLAGGTNLLDLMKAGVSDPATIVDITRVPDLTGIETLADGAVRVGAMVRNADLSRDTEFAARFPAVVEAMLSGASPQLRNAATVGGNLLQSTRCAYFYDPESACNRRRFGAGCDALGGETRGHAVLGWTDQCIATHPSDFCVPLAALGAVVEIAGPDGRRELPLSDLHLLPDADGPGGTALAHGDLIVALRLPAEAAGFADHARYVKVRERTSYAFALVSAAAMLRLEGGTIAKARIALGGVAAKPWRVAEAEATLTGRSPEAAAFGDAAEALMAGATPSGDNAAKIDLARRVAIRALTLAAEGTPKAMPALPASVFADRSATPTEGALADA